MLRLFRSFHPALTAWLLLLLVILKAGYCVQPVAFNPSGLSPISELLFGWLSTAGAGWQICAQVFTCLLFYAAALYLNRLALYHKLMPRGNYLPALFLVLLSSMGASFHSALPLAISMIFMLRSIDLLFRVYNRDHADREIFDAALLVALSSLLFFPMIVFALFILVVLPLLKPVRSLDIGLLIAGLFVPWFLAATAFFMVNGLPEFLSGSVRLSPGLPSISSENMIETTTKAVLIGLLSFLALILGYSRYANSLIQVRKFMSVLTIYIVFTTVAALLQPQFLPATLLLAIPVLSWFAAYLSWFGGWAKSQEALLWSVIILILFFEYAPLAGLQL